MRFSDLAAQYLKFFSARGASPRTCDAYGVTYGQFVEFLHQRGVRDVDLREFTPENVEAFSSYLAEAGCKASTVNVKLAALHSLGQYGVKTKDRHGKYLLAESPLNRVYRPKRQQPHEKYLYKAELQALVAQPKPEASQLALDLVVDTALRASEIVNATVGDLTLDGDRVVLAVRVKGGRPRTVTLGAAVADRLCALLRQREARPTEALILNERGQPWTRTGLSQMIQYHAKRAGITRIPVRAHAIRHSIATLAVASGADLPTVAAMLNHANLATVHRYVHRQSAVDGARDRVREVLA